MLVTFFFFHHCLSLPSCNFTTKRMEQTAREGGEDMDQDAAEGAAAAAGGDAGDGEFIEAGDIAAEFEVKPSIAWHSIHANT